MWLGSDSGFVLDVRPEAGLDIGSARYLGREVAWTAPDLRGEDPWLRAFAGGLLVTCGLHNVGRPSGGHGLHGRFALSAADDVRTGVEGLTAWATGSIRDDGLVCHRRIDLFTDRATVSVTDVVVNETPRRLQAPLLYHVNIGGSVDFERVEIDGPVDTSIPRESNGEGWPDWRRPRAAQERDDQGEDVEYVWEHIVSGRWMQVRDPRARLGVRVTWTGLDRVHQWVSRYGVGGVVAVEPANCSLMGREADAAQGRAPVIEAGGTRTTSLTIEVRDYSLPRTACEDG